MFNSITYCIISAMCFLVILLAQITEKEESAVVQVEADSATLVLAPRKPVLISEETDLFPGPHSEGVWNMNHQENLDRKV